MNAVETYIAAQAADIQKRLMRIREIILDVLPEADESIAYGMPAYKSYGRPLVYFAAHKKHIGFYALPTGHEAFKKEMAAYKQGKGSVQFPNDEVLPVELIRQIVQFRVAENKEKYAS